MLSRAQLPDQTRTVFAREITNQDPARQFDKERKITHLLRAIEGSRAFENVSHAAKRSTHVLLRVSN